jgi:hypothetical protein
VPVSAPTRAPVAARTRSIGTRPDWTRIWRAAPAPLLAAAVTAAGQILGWRGVDLPAQLYRVASFRAHGLTIWDSQWFGGHWTLSYSVLFPPLAGLAGVAAVTIVAAALAALAFDRLAAAYLGVGAAPAALVFAVSTAVQSAIGQLPFLAGEALALCACWAASRNRWVAAASLAAATSLCSPLAGAFVMLAMVAWAWSRLSAPAAGPSRRSWLAGAISVTGAAAVPIGASAVLFPGQGRMPYPAVDYWWEMAIAAALCVMAGRRHRTVRCGVLTFAAAATVSVLIPSAVGGNVGRMEDVLALPLAVALLWPRWPRFAVGRRLVLPVVAVPLVLSQWGPAWAAMTTDARQPSAQRPYFAPLLTALTRAAAGGPAGRVEVVPTKFHWEAAFVAPEMPLARGWERQLDEADNPLFYGPAAALNESSYRAWLVDNGVRFVALPDAPLDFSGIAEGRLVAAGVPGLHLVWHSAHWRLYAVIGSSGLVAGPAHLVSADGGRVVVSTAEPGPVLVRVRYSRNWSLASGAGCIAPAPARPGVPGGGTWVRVVTPAAERFSLRLSLLPSRNGCPPGR